VIHPTTHRPATLIHSPDSTGLVPGLPRDLHLVGAGGAGLSGAARLLLARGHRISGHDREGSPFTAELEGLGVALSLGASAAAHLPAGAGALARSAAIHMDDPQVQAALARGLPVLKYSDLVAMISPPGRTLGVAGTHGKTTTSWMLHHALRGVAATPIAGPAPGALVGGIERHLRTNAVTPEPGGWFAVEACEYDRSFLKLSPTGAIITNLEADHLDYYKSLENLELAFARFADRVHPDGLLVLGAAVPDRIEASAGCEVWRLGRELHIDLLGERQGNFGFRLRGPGWASPPLALGVPGSFNVENAALALGLAVGLAGREADETPARSAARAARHLAQFRGVARRFEVWGQVGDAVVVHDYAHHPTEVSATLEAARRAYPGCALHVLFQPHQFSRTARFMGDFVNSLRSADRVVVADVYGARQAIDDRGAGSEELVSRLRRAGLEAALGGDPESSSEAMASAAKANEGPALCLVLGAGDIDRIRDDLLDRLALRSPQGR
jgi:UDP-N-acetylmuramate--alanine ligase